MRLANFLTSAAGFLFLASGSMARAQAASRQIALPTPTGNFALGTVRMWLVDSARHEVMSPDPRVRRELVVQLWYPAASRHAPRFAAYVPDTAFYPMLRRDEDLSNDVRDQIMRLRTHADSAAPVSRDGPFPVLLFSHGMGVTGFSYTALIEEIASHGYVVVQIEHPYSGGTVLARGYVGTSTDSALTRMRLLPENLRDGFLASRVRVQAEDMQFVLRWLGAFRGSAPEQRLGNAFDLGRVGAMGHSFGGTTAIDFCRHEARVLGCADLDGRFAWDWPAYLEGLPRPLLYLRSDDLFSVKTRTDSAEVSARIDAERAAFDRSHAPTFEVIARHALHMDFSDFNFVGQPRAIALPFDPALMIRSFASFTMAFFEQCFRGDGALAQLLSSRIADTSMVVHVHEGRRP